MLAPSPGEVWCEDKKRAGRVVGLTVALTLDPVIDERAEVRWSATCLMDTPGATKPSAFGEIGMYEVIRRGGRWRVTRELSLMAF